MERDEHTAAGHRGHCLVFLAGPGDFIYLEVLHWGWYRFTVRGHREMWVDVVRDTGVLKWN